MHCADWSSLNSIVLSKMCIIKGSNPITHLGTLALSKLAIQTVQVDINMFKDVPKIMKQIKTIW